MLCKDFLDWKFLLKRGNQIESSRAANQVHLLDRMKTLTLSFKTTVKMQNTLN